MTSSSLGLLGQYGSSSDISDSDEEDGGRSLPRPPGKREEAEEAVPPGKDRGTTTDPLALVASDESDTSSDSEEESASATPSPSPPLLPLPLPDLAAAVSSSVFSSPYHEAEERKMVALKKHGEFNQLQSTERVTRRRPRPLPTEAPPSFGTGAGDGLFDDQDSSVGKRMQRKRRSGAGRGLVPPKRAMSLHRTLQAKERPWTLQ